MVELLERLDRTQLSLRRAEPLPRSSPNHKVKRTWLLYCEPNSALREGFDLASELLVVLIPSHKAQARDIHRAERAILRDFRLDRGLVLVLARDGGAAKTLSQPARQTGRTYIFRSFADLLSVTAPQAWLRTVLRDEMGSGDLFAPGPPVFGWDFIGRKNEISAIMRHLRGGRPVGLYGLRKVGKTSLMRYARKQLIADSGAALDTTDDHDAGKRRIAIPVHVDMQELGFAENDRIGFMRKLISATYRTLRELDLEPAQLGLPESLGKNKAVRALDRDEVQRQAEDLIETLIEWAGEAPQQHQLLLFIDEYERLLSDQGFPLRDGLILLDYFRGQVQSHPGTFNFLIAGLSRRLASTPTFLGGRQNPLLGFLVDFPLAGLTHQELHELMRKIGRRLSLAFSPEAHDLIWAESGGHPYLARAFGRFIDQRIPYRERSPNKTVDGDLVAALRDTFS
ncbi:MAG: ATP-binding protein, partial [Myxococcota bacterium]